MRLHNRPRQGILPPKALSTSTGPEKSPLETLNTLLAATKTANLTG